MIDKKNTVKGKTPIMVKEIKTDRIFKKKTLKYSYWKHWTLQ